MTSYGPNNTYVRLRTNFRDENETRIALLHAFTFREHAVFQALADSSRAVFEYAYYMHGELDSASPTPLKPLQVVSDSFLS